MGRVRRGCSPDQSIHAQKYSLRIWHHVHCQHHVVLIAQLLQEVGRFARVHFNMDLRVHSPEIDQDLGKNARRVILNATEPHALSFSLLAHGSDSLVHETKYSPGVTEKNIAFGAELDVLARAFENRDAQHLLQPLDLHADGGLRSVQFACSARETRVFGDCDKNEK